MAEVVVYVKSWCPFCHRALTLFDEKGVTVDVIDVEQESGRWREMLQRSQGRSTVPQIFINGQHVGGSDELYALEGLGRLDPLLAFPVRQLRQDLQGADE